MARDDNRGREECKGELVAMFPMCFYAPSYPSLSYLRDYSFCKMGSIVHDNFFLGDVNAVNFLPQECYTMTDYCSIDERYLNENLREDKMLSVPLPLHGCR